MSLGKAGNVAIILSMLVSQATGLLYTRATRVISCSEYVAPHDQVLVTSQRMSKRGERFMEGPVSRAALVNNAHR